MRPFLLHDDGRHHSGYFHRPILAGCIWLSTIFTRPVGLVPAQVLFAKPAYSKIKPTIGNPRPCPRLWQSPANRLFPDISKASATLTFTAVKQLACLILASLIFAQISVRTAWTLHYQWDKAVYLRACENKNRPELHCDGKCYLKKRLTTTQQDSQAPQLPESFFTQKEALLFFEAFGNLSLNKQPLCATPAFPPYAFYVPESPGLAIFHPPDLRKS